ncbi:MAG: hypothetical protein BWY31_04504 [Lentisphaerae bacterium ADurb.Bin242]|nr:MAG: hypothetical protein BWY31_04504 [Lentisphaerae bacterium ADurb.Bin242]
MRKPKPVSGSFKDRIPAVFFASFSVAFSLLLSGLTLYYKNSGEFTFRFSSLTLVILLGTLAVTALLALPQLLLRKWKYFSLLNALILALGYVIWLQNTYWSEFFPDYMPPLSDMELPVVFLWGFNVFLYLLPLVPAVVFHRWCSAHCGKLCAIILTAQMVPLFFLLVNYSPPKYDFYEYSIQEKDKFNFASRENVVIVVVDCMSEFLFKRLLKKSPEIGDLFQDFTCFDGIVSGTIPQTIYAVPALLTGVEYSSQENTPWKGDHGEYLQFAFLSEKSLFRNFKKAGFRCEAYPYALQAVSYNKDLMDNVVPRTNNSSSFRMFSGVFFLKLVPYFAKALLADSDFSLNHLFVGPGDEVVVSSEDLPYDVAFYRRLSSEMKLGDFEKGMKYLHLQGAHGPLKINEKLEPALDTNVERQFRGSLRNLELLLKNMKSLGIYDEALIVVTGDHTERYTPEMITLIKRPGEKHPAPVFNSVPCRLSDLPAAILAEKNLLKSADSLFTRPGVKGSGFSIRADALPETLVSSHWRAIGPCAVPEKISSFMNMPASLENDLLSTPRTDIDNQVLLRVWFRAVELNREHGWETEPVAPVRKARWPDLYQTRLKGLPDGEYAFFIIEEIGTVPEDSGTSDPVLVERRETALPQFHLIRNGRFERMKTSPRTVPRPMRIGEQIVFHPFRLYPPLVFSNDCMPGKDCLSMRDTDTVSVLLPSGMPPLFLHLSLNCIVMDKAVFQVYDGETLIYSGKLESRLSISIDFKIPESSRKKKRLDLSFRLVPQYKNPERKHASVFHLTEVGLKTTP